MVKEFKSVFEALEYKEEVCRELEKILSPLERKRALRDPHSRRRPRPCGMTVHTGIGCSFKCIYCYIEDMGFPWSIKPYPLTGMELVYALAKNPYFIPGREGSLIAIGSVTEPFIGVVKDKTIEYMRCIKEYLGNPIQFSTKAYLTGDDAKRIASVDRDISPLITIISIKYDRILEPHAPPAEKRFETIKNLSSHGLKPILFYRPIIPGINSDEYIEIFDRAKNSGAIGVVAGAFRATKLTLERLKKAGFDLGEVYRRLPRMPHGREQISVDISDIKGRILGYARKIGLLAFPMACMANLYTHNMHCWPMKILGVETDYKLKDVDESDVRDAARLMGLRLHSMKVSRGMITIRASGPRDKLEAFKELIKDYYKMCVKLKR